MSLRLIEPDAWPRLRIAINEERERLVEALVKINPEDLRFYQGSIAALDWVLDEAKPKPPPRLIEEDDE